MNSAISLLLFLVFIKDLSVGSLSNAILFANGTSLLLVVLVRNTSANDLNKNLLKDISVEICFHPDPFIPTKCEDYWRETLKTLNPQFFRLYLAHFPRF